MAFGRRMLNTAYFGNGHDQPSSELKFNSFQMSLRARIEHTNLPQRPVQLTGQINDSSSIGRIGSLHQPEFVGAGPLITFCFRKPLHCKAGWPQSSKMAGGENLHKLARECPDEIVWFVVLLNQVYEQYYDQCFQ